MGPNEDFNTRSLRPGRGVISPPGARHQTRAEDRDERWVNTDGDSWGVRGEFHSFSAAEWELAMKTSDCATRGFTGTKRLRHKVFRVLTRSNKPQVGL